MAEGKGKGYEHWAKIHNIKQMAKTLNVYQQYGFTSPEQLEAAFADFCARHSLAPACIAAAASIDLKADEAGLLAFCRAHGWPITFYSAEQLRALPGPFTPSPFVQSVTGVDNVCERAAVLASGGCIRIPKQAGGGVTLALALGPYAPDWRWQNG